MMRSSRTGLEAKKTEALSPGDQQQRRAREHGSLQSLKAGRKDCGCPQHRHVRAERPGNLRALS